jgi:hypothetical protein
MGNSSSPRTIIKSPPLAAIHVQTMKRPFGIGSIPDLGVDAYSVSRDQDVRLHVWVTEIWFDGDTGALQKLSLPNSEHAGKTVSNWLWSCILRMSMISGRTGSLSVPWGYGSSCCRSLVFPFSGRSAAGESLQVAKLSKRTTILESPFCDFHSPRNLHGCSFLIFFCALIRVVSGCLMRPFPR